MSRLKQTTYKKFVNKTLDLNLGYLWHTRDMHIPGCLGIDIPDDDDDACSKLFFGNYLVNIGMKSCKAPGYPEARLAMTYQRATLKFGFEI